MKLHLRYLMPSVFEVAGAIFFTIVVVVLANSNQLLSYYGLQSSDQVVHSNAGHAVTHALSKLDGLSATDRVVTFVIWAVVGMICFSVVQGIGRAIQEFEYEKDLSSGKYIHPSTFTEGKFWKGVVEDFLGLGVGLIFVGLGTYLFWLIALPIGLTYCHLFLFSISFSNALYFLLGLFVLFIGLLIVDVCLRILLHRRHIVMAEKL